jgi:RNA polymerase sigma-70 factor (ECF subfamily)
MVELDLERVEKLLIRVAAADRAAFRELYDLTARLLFSICLRLLRNRNAAEDVVQELYVRIWLRAWQFDPEKGTAKTWLTVLARRMAIDELRKRKPETVSPDDVEIADPMTQERIEAGADGAALTRCLGGLDEGARRAIVLAYRDGYSYEELAQTLSAPVGTVKSWVSRGLQRLRVCLERPV